MIVNAKRSAAEKEEFRQKLVSCATKAETKLLHELQRNTHIIFEFQKIISGFIVDFYFPSKRLVVELDGSIHTGREKQDRDRTLALLKKQSVSKVLRFSNEAIFRDCGKIISIIQNTNSLPIKKRKPKIDLPQKDTNTKYGINPLASTKKRATPKTQRKVKNKKIATNKKKLAKIRQQNASFLKRQQFIS